ncbi:MAG: hypothetical protein Q4B82_01525 [Alysiella sp.]|nr:hypothetical protein [Alysiella sp.]MDO4433242.1 hypothetical protein [Alysiella sp.]
MQRFQAAKTFSALELMPYFLGLVLTPTIFRLPENDYNRTYS